jgi:hypothetical protein
LPGLLVHCRRYRTGNPREAPAMGAHSGVLVG